MSDPSVEFAGAVFCFATVGTAGLVAGGLRAGGFVGSSVFVRVLRGARLPLFLTRLLAFLFLLAGESKVLESCGPIHVPHPLGAMGGFAILKVVFGLRA